MKLLKSIAVASVVLLAMSCLPAAASATERRVALIFGNGAYRNAPLSNPVNDAADMAQVLQEQGFVVNKRLNATRQEMLQAVREFGEQIKEGGVGLFFYAGHGLQVKGENYLVPVDAAMTSEDEVEDYCLNVASVLRKMETAGNRLNIIILDACRNNPFVRKSRDGVQGLAKMDAPTGSLLAYATAPGSVAADGSGRNGLYTSLLLKHMKTPGLEIGKLFRLVRVDVLDASGKQQVPWESSSLTGEFHFVSGDGATGASSQGNQQPASESRDLILVEEQKKGSSVPAAALTTPEVKPAVEDSERRRVAVLYFDNSSKRPEMDVLRKGLADMMITDLSQVPMLKLVEREKLEEILKEQNLQQNGSFDPATASKIGKLLGAEIILVGGYFEMFQQFRMDARLVEVETGKILKAEGVNGKTDDFFSLKDQLVLKIARNLDARINREAISKSEKLPFDQAVAYSKALDMYDRGEKAGAKEALRGIVARQPGFKPAKNFMAKIE